MQIAPFATEHFFAQYEFTTPHQLCNSDCETVSVAELLQLADISLEDFGRLTLGYTESQGNPQLRKSLAAAYATATADDILVLGTPVEGIYLAARALLEPSDEVIVLTPAYDALINVFEHIVAPGNLKRWTVRPTPTGWELDFAELETLLSPNTKLLVVNFPHNPTGYLPTRAQLQRLTKLVDEHNLWLFCDEMYFGLVHSGTPPVPSVADLTKRSIVLSGLSKTYGLPGLRTGWLVIQDKMLYDQIANWKFYTSICAPAPSEFLALAGWSVREKLRQRSVAQIEANLSLFEAFFRRWPRLFEWRRPQSGSTALVKMHVPSVTDLSTRLAKKAGVLIQPATTLGSDDHHMRMGFGRRAFGDALKHFETFLEQHADLSRGSIRSA